MSGWRNMQLFEWKKSRTYILTEFFNGKTDSYALLNKYGTIPRIQCSIKNNAKIIDSIFNINFLTVYMDTIMYASYCNNIWIINSLLQSKNTISTVENSRSAISAISGNVLDIFCIAQYTIHWIHYTPSNMQKSATFKNKHDNGNTLAAMLVMYNIVTSFFCMCL